MNVVGNDNYKPGLTPPNPIRKSSGWLSSNMTQLMVFLNGLILTVTAYATLSVFIQEIVKEDFLKTTNEIQEYISSAYQNTEENFLMVGNFIKISSDKDQALSLLRNKERIKMLNNFEELFLIENSDSYTNIISIPHGENFSNKWKEMLSKIRIPAEPNVENNLFVIGNEKIKIEGLQDSIFAVAFKLDQQGYLIGFVDKHKFIKSEWLAKRKSLHNLNIVNDKGDVTFRYIGSSVSKDDALKNYYASMSQLSFANQLYDIQFNLKLRKREAFLQKIPLLMLCFGVTLTMIGTLYVRNNQNQSQKLSSMNKELAYKNYELNQEVSERERLNVLIQKSEKENRSIINSVSDIIFEVSVDGTLVFLNESWETVTGFNIQRSLGQNLFDLLYKEDKSEQQHNFQLLVQGKKKSYRAFTKLRSADGKYRTVEIAFSMLRHDENQDIRAVGTITDVEERRRAEQALGEAEKKYRKIVENAASGIYQVTPEGQFLSVNPSFAKTLGYDSSEDVLRDVNKAQEQIYVDTALRNKMLKEIETLKIPKNFEVQVTRKDGEVIWVSENIRPVLDDDGTLLFYEGSIEDVNQRKKAEIALKEAKVESDLANRAKSEFLANMSHELRTPLNAVIGFAEIIKDEAFGALSQPEYKEYAENIHQSGNGLLNVINEILDVSHIETGNRDLKESLVLVKDTVASSIEMISSKIEAKKIRVDNKVTDEDLKLVGEKHAIKQMLLNLLSNAVRFSPEGSYVMVDAEIEANGNMCISITDTGIGLTEDELEKALMPFGQVSAEHKREDSGTGLGLTLVKSLVELHGGSLDMVSQKNIGTTATLTFPEKRVSKPRVSVSAEEKV